MKEKIKLVLETEERIFEPTLFNTDLSKIFAQISKYLFDNLIEVDCGYYGSNRFERMSKMLSYSSKGIINNSILLFLAQSDLILSRSC